MSNEHKKFFHFATYMPVLFLIMLGVAVAIYMIIPIHFFNQKSHISTLIVGGILFIIGSGIIITTEIVKQPFMKAVQSHEYKEFMHGMYRFSRHPITIGFIAMFFGVGFILNSLSFIMISIVFSGIMAIVVVPRYEEAMLALSKAYDEYRKHVRRWI